MVCTNADLADNSQDGEKLGTQWRKGAMGRELLRIFCQNQDLSDLWDFQDSVRPPRAFIHNRKSPIPIADKRPPAADALAGGILKIL